MSVPNPINVGYGWGQDIAVSGHQPNDVFRFGLRQAAQATDPSAPVYEWQGQVEDDGLLRIRFDGDQTVNFRPGNMVASLALVRGTAAGVVQGLPMVPVRGSMLTAPTEANDVLVAALGEPIALAIGDHRFAGVDLTLVEGLAGQNGKDGESIPEIDDLSLLFENGLV